MRALAPALCLALAGVTGCPKPADPAASLDPAATASAEPPASDIPGSRSQPVVSAPAAASVAARRVAASAAPSASSAAGHPLEAWMRGPASSALDSGNLEAIAGTFEQMAAWAPKDYPNWASISVDGAEAARVGHLEAVKAACRSCHTQYQARYKAELTARPLL